MKTARTSTPNRVEVARLLLSGELAFAPLRVVGLRRPEGVGPDYLLELEWENRRRRFAVEYKKLSTPKRLEETISQANRNAMGDLQPMVVVPYLRPAALERLIETRTSGIDLSGNGVVMVPGDWFVFRSGEQNKYPTRSPIKAIYANKSSLVGRVLLLRSDFASVTAVQEEITRRGSSLSLGMVSKVLQALEEDLVIQRRPNIRLVQKDRLISKLKESFRTQRLLLRRLRGRIDNQAAFLDQIFASARGRSEKLVGQSESIYTALPSTELTIFTTAAVSVLENTTFEETTRFPNVSVVETTDELVYFDSRPSNGYLWTPPLQLYLTLANGGKREQEIAEQLRPIVESEARGPR